MAFGPLPFDFVSSGELVEFHPKILIDDRLFVRRFPAIAFPPVDPRRDPVFEVIRVGDNLDGTALFQKAQAFHRCRQFHAVVRGVGLGAEELTFLVAVAEDAGPATLARIAQTSAICDQLNLFQATSAHSSVSLPAS